MSNEQSVDDPKYFPHCNYLVSSTAQVKETEESTGAKRQSVAAPDSYLYSPVKVSIHYEVQETEGSTGEKRSQSQTLPLLLQVYPFTRFKTRKRALGQSVASPRLFLASTSKVSIQSKVLETEASTGAKRSQAQKLSSLTFLICVMESVCIFRPRAKTESSLITRVMKSAMPATLFTLYNNDDKIINTRRLYIHNHRQIKPDMIATSPVYFLVR